MGEDCSWGKDALGTNAQVDQRPRRECLANRALVIRNAQKGGPGSCTTSEGGCSAEVAMPIRVTGKAWGLTTRYVGHD